MAAMHERNLTHLVVYGDREHFANIAYLTGYDPRFEEALLIIGQDRAPLLLVGNEGEAYLPVSPLMANGSLRTEVYQPLSLLDQPRGRSRQLEAILADEGLGTSSRVGCAGWKYYGENEERLGNRALEIPAFIADHLRDLCGTEHVENATAIFMSPDVGLRSRSSPAEIAYFEYTGALASEAMREVLNALEPGKLDYDVVAAMRYTGEPLGCHLTFVSGENREKALSGPVGATMREGDPFASNICFWGSNSCRAGWLVRNKAGLPTSARDYVEQFAAPYFAAMDEWFSMMRPGVIGGEIYKMIHRLLPDDLFGITLNPGHLIHLDEWLSSPITPESSIPLASGMVMQSDVIPVSERYFSTRVEDGLVIADEELHERIGSEFPDVLGRCVERRRFMREVLGMNVPESVLPLSNIPGIVPPFVLEPQNVFVMAGS